MTIKEQFETWFLIYMRSNNVTLSANILFGIYPDGKYTFSTTRVAFDSWHAALENHDGEES